MDVHNVFLDLSNLALDVLILSLDVLHVFQGVVFGVLGTRCASSSLHKGSM